MPKMKTKKIVVRRYKVTKTGKLMHRTQGIRHLMRKKSKSTQRREKRPQEITNRKFERSIKGFLGGTSI